MTATNISSNDMVPGQQRSVIPLIYSQTSLSTVSSIFDNSKTWLDHLWKTVRRWRVHAHAATKSYYSCPNTK